MKIRNVMKAAEVQGPIPMDMGAIGKCEASEPAPHYREMLALRKEAERALCRAVAHAAANGMTYDLSRVAKALEALNF